MYDETKKICMARLNKTMSELYEIPDGIDASARIALRKDLIDKKSEAAKMHSRVYRMADQMIDSNEDFENLMALKLAEDVFNSWWDIVRQEGKDNVRLQNVIRVLNGYLNID